jgi:hypothetical protein
LNKGGAPGSTLLLGLLAYYSSGYTSGVEGPPRKRNNVGKAIPMAAPLSLLYRGFMALKQKITTHTSYKYSKQGQMRARGFRSD